MTLLKVMSEVVMGVVYMEVDKVADMVVNMKVDNVANQGGRRCASAQAALDEKFGLGRKF